MTLQIVRHFIEIADVVARVICTGAGAKDPELTRGPFIVRVRKSKDPPVPLRVQLISGRSFDKRQSIRALVPFETERFGHVADLETAHDRYFLEADKNILEGDIAAREIKLRFPIDTRSNFAFRAQAGAAEADGVLDGPKYLFIAGTLIDENGVGIDTANQPDHGFEVILRFRNVNDFSFLGGHVEGSLGSCWIARGRGSRWRRERRYRREHGRGAQHSLHWLLSLGRRDGCAYRHQDQASPRYSHYLSPQILTCS